MELSYEVIYRLGHVHQVSYALSRLRMTVNEEDDEVDYNIPTFEEEKELSVESILHLFTRRKVKDAALLNCAARGGTNESRKLTPLADLPKVRRSSHAPWEDTC